jgi:hypothetical protein
MLGQVCPGYYWLCHVSSGKIMLGQTKSGQASQDRICQVRSC